MINKIVKKKIIKRTTSHSLQEYINIFISSNNRAEFIIKCNKKFPLTKKGTFIRRYYDARNYINEKNDLIKSVVIKKSVANKMYMNHNQYKEIFLDSKNKKDFIDKCKRKFPVGKVATFDRKYYYTRKKISQSELNTYANIDKTENQNKYDKSIMSQPSRSKIIMLNDMKRMKFKLTRIFLRKYGLTEFEINWLDNYNYIKLNDKGILLDIEYNDYYNI